MINLNLKENELRLILRALQEKLERILDEEYIYQQLDNDKEKECRALCIKLSNAYVNNTGIGWIER
nr:MAG TPA: hypothetical protein [Caudoviricetes sp.]